MRGTEEATVFPALEEQLTEETGPQSFTVTDGHNGKNIKAALELERWDAQRSGVGCISWNG